MVYKKYIKRDGKVFGPYYCESYRDGDKIRTRFISGPKKKTISKKIILFFIIGIIFIGILFYSLSVGEEVEEEGALAALKSFFSFSWLFDIGRPVFEGPEQVRIEVLYPDLEEVFNASKNSFFNVTLRTSCLQGNCRINTSLAYELADCFDNNLDPIPICTCDDLNKIRDYLTANYILKGNIDCSDTINWDGGLGFEPIGEESGKFNGVFNGRGYSIINLFINRGSENGVGLFGYIDNSEIKNISLENGSISGKDFVGGLIGKDYKGVLENSYFKGNISGENSVGGLIGSDKDGLINNSYFIGNITGGDFVGGLVGYHEDSDIFNSYSNCNVEGDDYVGGLVGKLEFESGVPNPRTPHIFNSYSMGNITGQYNVGGLIGIGSGIINNSYSRGNVTGEGYVGGLVGFNIYHIENSYSTSNVTAPENTGGVVPPGYGIKGSLVGYNHIGYEPTFIKNSFFLQYNGDVCVGLDSAINTECAEISNEDYFYDADNEPMIRWSYPPWSNINDEIDYPVLDFKLNDWSETNNLISDEMGDIPFYTNVSNPNLTILNVGESEIIVFWVNATGDVNSNYIFYAYSNLENDFSIGSLSEDWNVRIIGEIAPNIILISPEDSVSYAAGSELVFNYNVDDDSDILSCSLIVNNVVSLVNSLINQLEIQEFTQTFSPGTYFWSINCTDVYENTGNSSIRSFTIDSPPEGDGNGNGGGGNGGGGAPPLVLGCVENWTCSDWTDCINKTKIRNCSDLEDCDTNKTKPVIILDCDIQENLCDNGIQDSNEEGIDCGGDCPVCSEETPRNNKIFFIIIILLTLFIILFFLWKSRQNKSKLFRKNLDQKRKLKKKTKRPNN